MFFLCVLLLHKSVPHCSSLPRLSPYTSMRYSRMLEESSFANRKSDYVWLLILSSIMLLVRSIRLPKLTLAYNKHFKRSGTLTTREHPVPLFPARLRSYLPMVPSPSFHTDLTLRFNYYHCAISPISSRGVSLDIERDVACGGW